MESVCRDVGHVTNINEGRKRDPLFVSWFVSYVAAALDNRFIQQVGRGEGSRWEHPVRSGLRGTLARKRELSRTDTIDHSIVRRDVDWSDSRCD